MYIPFTELPESARIWVYQSNRAFTEDETEKVTELLTNFMSHWNNHGDSLKSSFLVKYNQFILIGIDEAHKEASGCSIDSSVQVMKKIEKLFEVDLFDKMKTAFKIEQHINIVSLADFQKYTNEGEITSDTIVFNNMINTIADFKQKWEVKAKNSWHARYINTL